LPDAGDRMNMERLDDIPHLKEMLSMPYSALKAELVSAGPRPIDPDGKGRQLDEKLQMLTEEFNGRTRIEFLHAVLIVLIRRQIGLQAAREVFFDLWESEVDFLCKHLALRWLVSACDTICDHPRNTAEATTAIAASLLINTVKFYETERRTLESLDVSQPRFEALHTKRADLFDGVTTFRVGRGNAIRNLVKRLEKTSKADATLVSRIFFAAVERLFQGDTVFLRFRRLHTSDATKW
jgi:hypothetical protein